MSTTRESIDPRWTVNETIRRHPGAVAVFGRHGIDSCCGGDLPVAEAAERHGVAVESLLEELEAARSDA